MHKIDYISADFREFPSRYWLSFGGTGGLTFSGRTVDIERVIGIEPIASYLAGKYSNL